MHDLINILKVSLIIKKKSLILSQDFQLGAKTQSNL